MKILITNDDGIEAEGLQALHACLPEGAEVMMIAPDDEKSASSHSISLGRKLRVSQHPSPNGAKRYSINGTPADCVKWALYHLEESELPDLIISGINQGANTGVSVYYSGTISAAREGFINHVPAFAVSLCDRHFRDFKASQKITRQLAEAYLSGKIASDVMLSVNVPPLVHDEIQGVKITKQANSRFVEEFIREEHKGEKIYTLAGEIEVYDSDGTSDEEAISKGYISVTPLRLDMTDYKHVEPLKKWLNQTG